MFPFEFSFPDIFGLIKNNRLGIAKNKYEITVNMEQQNPLENEVRTNIQTDQLWCFNVYSIFLEEILVFIKNTFCLL